MPTAAHAEGSPKFGLFKGRLLPCERKSVCFSTSSVNSVEKYIRPWVFEGDSDAAWAQLKLALQAKETGLVTMKVAEVDDSKHYIHMIGKSTVPPTSVDDVEFLMAYPSDKVYSRLSRTMHILIPHTHSLSLYHCYVYSLSHFVPTPEIPSRHLAVS